MELNYSTYEAKSRFSEVIRHVREGRTVTVSYHGTPVAEIRPISNKPKSLAERIVDLERKGEIIPGGEPDQEFQTLANRPGALRRFLDDRNE